jgi:hypothetical protein
MKPFIPSPAGTVNINVSGSSQSVSLAVTGGPQQVRVMNNGTATVWVNFGPTGVTAATASGMPVGPGVIEVITIPDFGATPYAAAIAAGSTGNVYFTPGYGI